MALLDDIGTKLTTDGLVDGTTGWTLAKAYQPDSPDTVVALYEVGGQAPQTRVGMDHPEVQVRVRGGAFGYAAAQTKIVAIKSALHTYSGTISGTRYAWVKAVHSAPIPLGYDERNRPELAYTFQIGVSR